MTGVDFLGLRFFVFGCMLVLGRFVLWFFVFWSFVFGFFMLWSFMLVILLVVMLGCVGVQSVLGSVLEVPRELLAKDTTVAEEVKALWVVGTAPLPAVAVAEGLWGRLAEGLVELWVGRGMVGWFWLVV